MFFNYQVEGEWMWRPAVSELALNCRERRLVNRQLNQASKFVFLKTLFMFRVGKEGER